MTTINEGAYIPPGPVADAFMRSNAFVRGIRGPIGSGKSTACVMEIVRKARAQKPSTKDGKRRSRWAVIRNTYPELKTTTINTWHQWVSPQIGRWVDQGPPTHHLIDTTHDIEVLFLALDSPNDIKKLLSLELTGAWINEAREVPKAVLDALTGRVGRYPAMAEGGCSWSGVIMDTNAPEDDHWWAVLADFPNEEQLRNTLEAERQLREMGALEADQRLYEFFSQPGGMHKDAENIDNLPAGYYIKATAGKRDDWVKVYVHNNYGTVQDGKPVIPEYNDNLHCKEFTFNPSLGLWIGLDFGLTPAALFLQRTVMGGWRAHTELCTGDMGAVRFSHMLRQHIATHYPNVEIHGIIGDPSGDNRAQTDETTPFQILNAAGIKATPASSNEPTLRREAWAQPLSRIIDGEPGLIVHPNCKTLRKGLIGGYRYKRIQTPGQERYSETPDKNIYSHIVEAGGYVLMDGGEGKAIIRPKRPAHEHRAMTADTDYSMFS
jgi:hypothetical protein